MSEGNEAAKFPRVMPAGWVPLSAAIAWVAQRTAVVDWDEHFYFSANQWPHQKPAETARDLRKLLAGKGPVFHTYPSWLHLADDLARRKLRLGENDSLLDFLDPAEADDRVRLVRAFVEGLLQKLEGAEALYESSGQHQNCCGARSQRRTFRRSASSANHRTTSANTTQMTWTQFANPANEFRRKFALLP